MKRLLSLVLLVCMLAALAACATKAKVAEAPILTEPETTEPETDAPAQPPTDPPAPPETGEDDDPALTHGTVVDDVYTNETLNLRVALADGFIFFDDAQIAQMCGMSEAMFRGTEMAKEVARVGQMIDMVMASPNGSNLSLTIHPAQKFLENATETEADAICDGTDAFVPAVMEHIELAGIHSGDSACVIPPKSIPPRCAICATPSFERAIAESSSMTE